MARPPKYMLNPLGVASLEAAPDWGSLYDDPTRPLLLDIGCAKGQWLRQLAAENIVRLEKDGRPFNYCGVELYEPLVLAANEQAKALGHRNLHYLAGNAVPSLRALQLLNLQTVCIQFPDPWSAKKRFVRTPEGKYVLKDSGDYADSCYF
ncbi:hypothetical protein CYMTET_25684 [Cymbomonas tetramitiformis]|uniref:tRNA (guanine(46)-N(7))-methyltransferase n=1 Tax=Cymbomonas tetramitiformis TaxID=36881 RepID=A0AAE0FTX0_9CHLO|nr:hypothetical protein CYMTET_25684 [Cymbomonas tetramitiformis]